MKYFRFGNIPKNEKSICWFKLSFDQQSDISYALKCGESLDDALQAAGVDTEDVFEIGVSVFRMDADGLPEIQNLQQLVSMVSRIGQTAYTMTGEQVGTGTDAEPLITRIENVTESTATETDLVTKAEKILAENYGKIETEDESSDKIYVVDGGYKDFAGNLVEHSVTYRGKIYTQPKDGWNTKIGYYAFK